MTLPNLQDIKGIGKKRHELMLSKMTEKNLSLADVYAMSPETLKSMFSLRKRRIATKETHT